MPSATEDRSRAMPAKPKNVSAKLDSEVVRLAKIVAAYRDQDLSEYLSERLRPLVENDLLKHQQREQKHIDE